MDTYAIDCMGLFDRQGRYLHNEDGYHEDEYLPGFAKQAFGSAADGHLWIGRNHKGPDAEGIEAQFLVRLAEAIDFFEVGQKIECPTNNLDGQPATETGIVEDIAGDDVTVSWDGGVRTTQHFSALCGHDKHVKRHP